VSLRQNSRRLCSSRSRISRSRKTDAERFLTTVEFAKLRGFYIDHDDRTTVVQYARTWAAARPHRQSTARRVSRLKETHIATARFGDRRLAAVLPSEVQAWATDRAQVLARSTLRLLVSLLRSIYASAMLDRLVASSPAVRLQLPAASRARVIPLTVDQVRQLAAAMPERNRAMVVTQASLGLRIGELLALRVQDVDFLRRTARFAVAERLGHENANLVLSTYGHLVPNSEDRTRRAIDESWCAPGVPRESGGSL
jgi:integrase